MNELTMTYEEAKNILREKLDNMKMSFIAAGYYMKYIRDHEQFREDGYESIWEFAEDNYGIKKSTASRWMAMNDKFSRGGNSPILAEEFRGFEKSQLQEMLYLDDKQIETVTPDMTVKEIRKVRKPAESEKEKKVSPIDRGCITGKNPNGNCTCCGKDGAECCGQCDDDCNCICGWIDSAVAMSQQAEDEPAVDMNPPEEESDLEPKVIIEENVEVVDGGGEELYEEVSDQSDIELLQEELEKLKNNLDLMLSCYSENDIRVRKQRLMIGALEGMISDLDTVGISETEQPELPVLRNNNQRKEFLDNYQSWPVWFKVDEASEVYYRYELPDGCSIVICEYRYYLSWMEKYADENPNCIGRREYLLKPGYHYLEDCKTNTSYLIGYLKDVQKEGK